MGVVPTDGDIVDWTNLQFWLGPNEYGSFATSFTGDHKSPAANLVVGTNILIEVTHPVNGNVIGWRGAAATAGRARRRRSHPTRRPGTTASSSGSVDSARGGACLARRKRVHPPSHFAAASSPGG